ncbi:protein of unknown function [Candidatus Nitrosocosmicus franklandus]|uniref:Uncharacterized protein n=1 Tax=Candidatus Nitrosocosmicus franklandianus TaxID=1798806 RepID=A0A484I649_9ARCH|nr:protein of unknown function [Candidatus Nitrosocosmicus franklandus]
MVIPNPMIFYMLSAIAISSDEDALCYDQFLNK